MEAPTFVTLSAQVALQRQLEVVANNVANASTTGFKADRQLFQTYLNPTSDSDNVAFVQDRATYIDRSNGPIQPTGNPLDVAIQGDAFLGVSAPGGTQYTRDGRLHSGPDGTLLDSRGYQLQSADGQPIQLPENYRAVEIKGDGTVTVRVANQQPQDVGQIGLFRPSDPIGLRKGGDGMFTAPPGSMQPIDSTDTGTRLVQGSLEGSTVEPVKEIANMTELSRAYERLQTLLSDDNDREQKMIEALSKPS